MDLGHNSEIVPVPVVQQHQQTKYPSLPSTLCITSRLHQQEPSFHRRIRLLLVRILRPSQSLGLRLRIISHPEKLVSSGATGS